MKTICGIQLQRLFHYNSMSEFRPEERKTTSSLPFPAEKKFEVNTANCRGDLTLLREVIKRNNWREVEGTRGDFS